jgi:hypothetical protein
MKRILVLAVSALFLLAGAGSALATKPPVLDNTSWVGGGSIISVNGDVQNFNITFSISSQTGALFSGTATTDITGFENQGAPFTGYIATNKSITFTIQSPNPQVPNPVAVSAAKWTSKTIAGDIQVFPLAATGYFSVKKQK